MSLTITIRAEAPRLSRGAQVDLDRASDSLWRVQRRSGVIIGHLAIRELTDGVRFVAKRLEVRSGVFRELGEFCSADDAVDCLRYSS